MILANLLHASWRDLPLRADDPLLLHGRVLIIAPHADDETLGCGGLIARLCEQGRPPIVLIATDGTGSHPNSLQWPPDRLRALRETEAERATAELGLDRADLHFLRLRDTAAPKEGPHFEAACRTIEHLAVQERCDTILAPWLFDPHCDHEAMHVIAQTVAARLSLRLLAYPVWGWLLDSQTQIPLAIPQSGFRLDISKHLQKKRRAIRLHASQYSGLIADDPAGFRLPADLLAIFEDRYEIFLEPA